MEEGEKWLKINNNQVGYYRVNYTPSMWAQLTEQLKNNNKEVKIVTNIFYLALY